MPGHASIFEHHIRGVLLVDTLLFGVRSRTTLASLLYNVCFREHILFARSRHECLLACCITSVFGLHDYMMSGSWWTWVVFAWWTCSLLVGCMIAWRLHACLLSLDLSLCLPVYPYVFISWPLSLPVSRPLASRYLNISLTLSSWT